MVKKVLCKIKSFPVEEMRLFAICFVEYTPYRIVSAVLYG